MQNRPQSFAGLPLFVPRIMGILNLTPDSFSDGGKWLSPEAGLARAIEMINLGADIIDVGGESTRPGSDPVPIDEQIRRTVGVIQAISGWLKQNPTIPSHDPALPSVTRRQVRISIDTGQAQVARAAIAAGAHIINDVYAGTEADAHGHTTLHAAAETGAPIILMHMKGRPKTMQQSPVYNDVVPEVLEFLADRVEAAARMGIALENIAIDPGIGFGKTRDHNMALMASLDRFVATGRPVLLGTSRKRFMGAVCALPGGRPAAAEELVGATCATTVLGVQAGVQMFRVHDVQENRQAADLTWALSRKSG
jgi:dihydropteroate synthase